MTMKAMKAKKAMKAMKTKVMFFFVQAATSPSPSIHFTAMALPMKKAAAMKAMKKVMKAKTATGMTKDKLTKNKNGRIVSKAQSTRAKRNWANSGLKKWADAVKAARKALNLTGFVAIGGKSATDKELNAKAKALLK